jgi:hypothetical protein
MAIVTVVALVLELGRSIDADNVEVSTLLVELSVGELDLPTALSMLKVMQLDSASSSSGSMLRLDSGSSGRNPNSGSNLSQRLFKTSSSWLADASGHWNATLQIVVAFGRTRTFE